MYHRDMRLPYGWIILTITGTINMISHNFSWGSPLIAVTLSIASPAIAQSNPADNSQVSHQEETIRDTIVVTGSRIARQLNLDSSIPIMSIDAELLLQGGKQSMGDVLNQLPQLNSTRSQANSTRNIGTAGLNLLDLRGLGAGRTMVLINGRRAVSSTPGSYTVDINTIPTELLERVDLVTGGNSAVYGSDAIAGVVNFVMKRDYQGISLNSRSGISSRGDRGAFSVGGSFGRNFERGNMTFSAEYSKSNTLLFSQRNGQTGAFTGTPGFATVDTDIQCALDKDKNPIPGSILACDPNVRASSDGLSDTYFFGVNPGNTFPNVSLGGTVRGIRQVAITNAHLCGPASCG